MIVSICLHELAHGIVAINQGDNTPIKTGHMTIDPIVHMGAESIVMLCLFGIAWGAMPVNPTKFRSRKWGDLIVSAAGPISTLSTLAIQFNHQSALAMSAEEVGQQRGRETAQANSSQNRKIFESSLPQCLASFVISSHIIYVRNKRLK